MCTVVVVVAVLEVVLVYAPCFVLPRVQLVLVLSPCPKIIDHHRAEHTYHRRWTHTHTRERHVFPYEITTLSTVITTTMMEPMVMIIDVHVQTDRAAILIVSELSKPERLEGGGQVGGKEGSILNLSN